MAKKEPGFEEGMKRLEEIVAALEKGDASLSDSMKLFEEGSGLIRRCGDLLDSAEQQVLRLRKGPDGAPEELPFDVPED
ncbi:MAG: exodeoxyribonuclease VII small subunit [Oscillospiraceae bacterium]|nr:exodeoxyribonuclease VII small subunit [Oscillospiraceae bacterium]